MENNKQEKPYSIKDFIVNNAWAILTFIVWLIVAWTISGTKIRETAQDLIRFQQVYAEDVKRIDTKVDDLEIVNSEILQRLSSIETKLDLLLNDKIKNK